MKLLMFDQGAGARLGALVGEERDEVADLIELSRTFGEPSLPASLRDLIDSGTEGLDLVRNLITQSSLPKSSLHSLAGVHVLAPLAPPCGNILAMGSNYAKHAAEGARALGTDIPPPTIFTKAITTIAGPFDDLAFDFSVSEQLDWEVEVGVVIGKAGKNIPKTEALDHVFGYLVLNDISARDIQLGWGGQYFKGKSLDNSCPFGPWIVTADEVPDPSDLRLRLFVNGNLKQDASTKDMIHSVADIITWMSIGMTLLPGMLIATGTPEGVGFARTPKEFLKAGDLLESEVVGLGRLSNRIVVGSDQHQLSQMKRVMTA